MAWIETTHTTEKGPQLICVNLTNVKYIKQRDDGRALFIFVAGQAMVSDDTYVKVIGKIIAGTPPKPPTKRTDQSVHPRKEPHA